MPSSPFAWGVLGRNLTAMYGTAVLYFLLLVLLDALKSDPFLRSNLARGVAGLWEQVSVSQCEIVCVIVGYSRLQT